MKKGLIKVLMLVCMLGACTAKTEPSPTPQKPDPKTLRLTTTTSVNDSGLLEALRPHLLEDTNITLEVVSVGSGAAIEAGQRGDADVILVHSPAAEKKFVEEGYGLVRNTFMYNYFVIVGPTADTAGLKNKKVTEALQTIYDQKVAFVSRGDKSGTHTKEQSLWKTTGIDYEKVSAESFYVSAGSGMGATLTMASEKEAYTLTDLATYLSMKDQLKLDLIVTEDDNLKNDYSIIVINPDKHKNVDVETAKRFEEWMLSKKGKGLIAEYGKDKYGQALFFPYQ